MNCCLSSAGRRVALMRCFEDALHQLAIPGRVLAIDCSRLSAATHLAGAACQVPRCDDPAFIPAVLRLCEHEGIRLIIPTIDTELPMLAAALPDFAAAGVDVAVSQPPVIHTAADKTLTHAWLTSRGFPTVRQAALAQALESPGDWSFPLIAKPVRGSAGIGVTTIAGPDALRTAGSQRDDLVVQEIAPGAEHTVNCYVSRAGRCLCTIPHRRLEVRAGEVSKAVTVRHHGLMDLARDIAEALPGAYGALNIQIFLAEDGAMRVIEINPRFGGGYPLAHAAGARFPLWLIQEALGQTLDATCTDWRDGLVMLRYDDAVFVDRQAIGDELP